MVKVNAFIGVDPGVKGAFCLLIPSTKQVAFLPTTGKPHLIFNWIRRIQTEYNLVVTMVEDVHSLPKVSAKSNFNFGRNVERVNVIPSVAGCAVDLVTPKTWQKYVGAKTNATGKERAKAIKLAVAVVCERLYPSTNIRGPKGGLLDGLSDSLMIAHYASQTFRA